MTSWADRIKTANNIRFPPKPTDNHNHNQLAVRTIQPKIGVWWWNWCSLLHNESNFIKLSGPMTYGDSVECCWRAAENAWAKVKPYANTGKRRL